VARYVYFKHDGKKYKRQEDIPDDDNCVFERSPLENLARDNQLNAFKHNGFWHAMDNLRDKNELTQMWTSQNAPWKVW